MTAARRVAVIQARMGSSRLPGKILMPLAGVPVLHHVVTRVAAAGVFDAVVVATTEDAIDDPAAALAADCGAMVVRGSEDDVLSRFGLAAAASDAGTIMRITADCPLIDPGVLRAVVALYDSGDHALATNCRIRSFPRGLDCEYFSRAALDIMLAEATTVPEREHVTPYLYAHPERFSIADHVAEASLADWRLTLDTAEDYRLLTTIFDAAPGGIALPALADLLQANPGWRAINEHIEQKKV